MLFSFLKKMGLCMFRFDMHMLKSHSHTLQEKNLHDWHQENKKRSQRINVSIVTQKITDEVKLQVQ